MTIVFPAYDPETPSTGTAFIEGAHAFLELYELACQPHEATDALASLRDKLDVLRAPVEPVGLSMSGGVLELTDAEAAYLTPDP